MWSNDDKIHQTFMFDLFLDFLISMMHLNILYACGSEYYLTPAPSIRVVDEDLDLLLLLAVLLAPRLALLLLELAPLLLAPAKSPCF